MKPSSPASGVTTQWILASIAKLDGMRPSLQRIAVIATLWALDQAV